MKEVLDFIVVLLIVIAACGVIYGLYYVGKSVSYNLFYEGMVIEEIQDSVKKECLK